MSVAGLVLTSGVGAAYALWLRSSGDWNTGLRWERAMMLSLDRNVPRAVDLVMLALPWLGTNLTLLPIIAAFALWLWFKKSRRDLAAHLMITAVGSLIMNAVLKDVFNRARPELWPHRGQYQWASYPSGHAIVGVSVIFTIALMLYREQEWRWPLAAAAVLLVINLYSRVYLGVHWPTDLIGGLILGALWLGVTQYAFAPSAIRSIAARGRVIRSETKDPQRADRGLFRDPEDPSLRSG